jgi:hypothetical protein
MMMITRRRSSNATTLVFWMLRIWLGVGLTTLLLMGCGSSKVASTGNTVAASDDGTSTTEEQAATYAQAVNLRAGDVPGLVASGGSRTSEMEPLGSLGSRCGVTTIPAGSGTAIGSPTFQRRHESTGGATSDLPLEAVSSGVYVMRNAALASGEIVALAAAAKRAAVVKCVERHLMTERANVVSEGADTGVPAGKPLFSNVEVAALRSPMQGVSAYGLRISADLAIKTSGTKGQSRYYQSFLGFAVGPAVIVLSDTGSPRPVPAATEGRLLALLHSRAEANGER